MPAGGARGLKAFAAFVQRFGVRSAQATVGIVLEELVEELDLVRHPSGRGTRGGGPRPERCGARCRRPGLRRDASQGSLEGEDLDNFTELDLFLQQVALVADVDRLDPDADTVTLMTLHNAKGLEFPVVFISGLEDGLFPLRGSFAEPDELEEERRLFYVGITRAEDKLNLSWARQRRRAGDFTYGTLSSFVEAIPEELREERRSERLRLMSQSTPHHNRGRRFDGSRRSAPTSQHTHYEADPDEVMNQDLPRYVKGERVVHSTFGSGAVVEISGFGPDMKVTVNFDDAGQKKLLVRYAGLEKDWP